MEGSEGRKEGRKTNSQFLQEELFQKHSLKSTFPIRFMLSIMLS